VGPITLQAKLVDSLKPGGDAPLDQTSTPASMVVVLNWLEELNQRLPTSGK
jgi:hypothetical protein